MSIKSIEDFQADWFERKASTEAYLNQLMSHWENRINEGKPLVKGGFGNGKIVETNTGLRLEKLDQARKTLLPDAKKGPKRFRPIAFQWSAEAFFDENNTEWDSIFDTTDSYRDPVGRFENTAEIASLATEFDHNFTLVFDDIHDLEDERRENYPTYIRERKIAENRGMNSEEARKMGRDQAHLDGLYLREFVPAVLDETDLSSDKKWEIYSVMNEANRELIHGQSQDLWMELVDIERFFEGDLDDSTDFLDDSPSYLQMIDGKTNALFAASFYSGALMAEPSTEQLESIEKYARSLGTVFQIQDDLQEVKSASSYGKGSEDIGKGDSDLYNGKATVVATSAYDQITAELENELDQESKRDLEHKKAHLEHHYGNQETGEPDIAYTADSILEHHTADELADEYIDEAIGHLEDADPEGKSETLEQFVHYMKERDY